MDASAELTFVLLLFAFVAYNGVRYWCMVPYGSEVGSFTWTIHRGMLLSYTPGIMALAAQHSCQIPSEGSPRHALCHVPFLGRERTFALLAIASAMLWTLALSEVLMSRRARVRLPSGEPKQEDHFFSGS